MRNNMPVKERNLPSHKVSECGYVCKTHMLDGTVEFSRCKVLTSRKAKLPNGQSVYLCATHIREYEK